MSVSIDFAKANEVLLKALKSREKPADDIVAMLHKVILGSHKTYKYVLVTNLLAKAVNPKANALCLQACAPMSGAFNSRDLCHKVLVLFQTPHVDTRNFLQILLDTTREINARDCTVRRVHALSAEMSGKVS